MKTIKQAMGMAVMQAITGIKVTSMQLGSNFKASDFLVQKVKSKKVKHQRHRNKIARASRQRNRK